MIPVMPFGSVFENVGDIFMIAPTPIFLLYLQWTVYADP